MVVRCEVSGGGKGFAWPRLTGLDARRLLAVDLGKGAADVGETHWLA